MQKGEGRGRSSREEGDHRSRKGKRGGRDEYTHNAWHTCVKLSKIKKNK